MVLTKGAYKRHQKSLLFDLCSGLPLEALLRNLKGGILLVAKAHGEGMSTGTGCFAFGHGGRGQQTTRRIASRNG